MKNSSRRHKGNLRHLLLQNTASLVQFISSHTSLKEFHRTGMSTGDLLRRQLCPHDGWSGLEKDEDKKRKVGCPVVCFHWIAQAASFLQQSLAHFICKLECPPGSACSSVSSKSCTRDCLRFMGKLTGWVDESSGHESALTATTNA